mmetsp:Transcript_5823/g.9314  ORF Transcript_5823/g.9314 Transcript_5823/m.9314 type:complete len:91 (+) Transcript_5823:519-791(+)
MEDLDVKLDQVVKRQEHNYLDSVLSFVKVKEKELGELLSNLSDKNNSLSDKDEEIIKLKQLSTVLRQELFRADNKRIRVEEKMRECRDVY